MPLFVFRKLCQEDFDNNALQLIYLLQKINQEIWNKQYLIQYLYLERTSGYLGKFLELLFVFRIFERKNLIALFIFQKIRQEIWRDKKSLIALFIFRNYARRSGEEKNL